MSYDLFNRTRATRIIYNDGLTHMQEIRIAPGQSVIGIELSDSLARDLLRNTGNGDLDIKPHDPDIPTATKAAQPAVVLDGRFGIGDAIHQRGVIRELMRDHRVWLQTCHFRVYEDLVARGLNLIFKDTRLHAQAKTIARERELFPHSATPPTSAPRLGLSYGKQLIDKHGSILEAMAGCAGVAARPLDFSLPVPAEWTAAFKQRFTWNTDKPLLVYRPVVLRREWNGANRNPDPEAYRAIFNAIRDDFFVISVADLAPDREWIVGAEESADVKLHHGELTFEDMAALWQEAAIVISSAGFAPVLAQAVGTPSIIVYGGREDFATTQRAGQHLAPTLGIDADKPCACHTERHDCGSKHITLDPAIKRAKAFVEQIRKTPLRATAGSSILVFATTYVDSGDREKLTRQWLDLHTALNPECDFLIVDSASPRPVLAPEWRARFNADPRKFQLFDFGDNVGHLSRRGRDGWGRAFCRGLDIAVERGYAYALHVEGDSLLRVPAREIVATMRRHRKEVGSILVKGTAREIPGWVETGLMCFDTGYLKRSGFTARYNWPIRQVRPTPEFVVRELIGRDQLLMLDLKGLRGDKNQITAVNIGKLGLDWITHVHSDIWVYDEFVKANMPVSGSRPAGANQEQNSTKSEREPPKAVAVVVGGAKSVWDEIAKTEALAAAAGVELRFFVTNDTIPLFSGACTAVSLHPQKLKDWLKARADAGWPAPDAVWAHVKHPDATHFTFDWRGSSGLFAVRVARQLGYDHIILCGVPMTVKAGHIVRGNVPWAACEQFMGGWRIQKAGIAPYVRSWSGATAEMFGRPDRAFLGLPAPA